MPQCRFCSQLGQQHDIDLCLWVHYEEAIISATEMWLESSCENKTQRQKRNYSYRMYTRMLHGVLGKGVRKQPLKCIINGIRNVYPNDDPNEHYVGYHGPRKCDQE